MVSTCFYSFQREKEGEGAAIVWFTPQMHIMTFDGLWLRAESRNLILAFHKGGRNLITWATIPGTALAESYGQEQAAMLSLGIPTWNAGILTNVFLEKYYSFIHLFI